MEKLPASARLARKALKIILLPVVILIGVTRFTPAQWYWLDFVCLAFLLITAILLVVGRVFNQTIESDTK